MKTVNHFHFHIERVDHLHVGGAFEPSEPAQIAQAAPQAVSRRAPERPEPADFADGLREVRRLQQSLRKPCPTCGDTGQISCNPTGEVGQFLSGPCPTCRLARERMAAHNGDVPAGRR